MFELWARRNDTKKYEYITTFSKEDMKYFLIDKLDKKKYYEALIIQSKDKTCNLYLEFEEQHKKILKKK